MVTNDEQCCNDKVKTYCIFAMILVESFAIGVYLFVLFAFLIPADSYHWVLHESIGEFGCSDGCRNAGVSVVSVVSML